MTEPTVVNASNDLHEAFSPTNPPGRKLRVFSRPAWNSQNPYTSLLADALASQGLNVSALGHSYRDYPGGPAVLVYHWPNEFFFRRSIRRTLGTLALLARIWVGKLFQGQTVVWVAHNVAPHRRDGRRFRLARSLFFRALDGLVLLSETSRDLLVKAYPELADRPHVVVPHGHYRSRAYAPATLPAVPEGRPISLAFTGQVKRYKGADAVARAVAGLPPCEVELTVSGKCDEPDLCQELSDIAAASPNLQLDLRYLSDSEIEAAVDRCDVVILPYRDILNSGSALLALSRARPVLAPKLGSLTELQAQVGSHWLWLYEGDFGLQVLQDGLKWVRETHRPAPPDLSAHDWDDIGRAVASFLRSLARG